MIGKHALDVMIPIDSYPNISHKATLREAITEFERAAIDFKGYKSLPRALLVIDENRNLMGVVRRRDILQGLEPNFMKHIPQHHQKELSDIEGDPNLVLLSSGTIIKSMKAKAETPVEEVMQPVKDKVEYNEHIAKIIYLMISKDLNLIPVIKQGQVIGVVRSVDVFHEVAHLLAE